MKISELALREPVAIGCDATVADTAALILQMDLVISTDTAVANLAGALGNRGGRRAQTALA